MALMAGYKQTEVGVVPVEWAVCELGSLASGSLPAVKTGPFGSALTKATYVPAGYKVYGQEQVIRGDHSYGDYFISLKRYRELESYTIQPGDILLSLVGTIGKLLVVPEDAAPGVINPRLIRLSLDQQRISPIFFRFVFESSTTQRFLSRLAQGGTMPVLNATTLRAFCIPIPPVAEQKAIATALADVEEFLVALVRLIAKKRAIKQGAIHQLLNGQLRLPGFQDDWHLVNLGEFAFCFSGGTPSTSVPGFFTGHIPWITSGDLNQRYITQVTGRISATGLANSAAKMVKPGTLLLALYGATAGVSAITRISAAINQAVLAIIPDQRADVQFLFFMLSSQKNAILEKYTQGGQPNLSGNIVKAIEIYLPPISEQIAIANKLADMDAEIAALEARIAKIQALKQGMMQELLTGKTRLIKQGENHA